MYCGKLLFQPSNRILSLPERGVDGLALYVCVWTNEDGGKRSVEEMVCTVATKIYIRVCSRRWT